MARQQILDFARQSELCDVQVTILTSFPETPLYARLAAEVLVVELYGEELARWRRERFKDSLHKQVPRRSSSASTTGAAR